jgi:hypothetical protein
MIPPPGYSNSREKVLARSISGGRVRNPTPGGPPRMCNFLLRGQTNKPPQGGDAYLR